MPAKVYVHISLSLSNISKVVTVVKNFHAFLSSTYFFSKSTIQEYGVSNRLDLWVQSVCLGYQQTILEVNKLKLIENSKNIETRNLVCCLQTH